LLLHGINELPYHCTAIAFLEAQGHVDAIARLRPDDQGVCSHVRNESQINGTGFHHALLFLESIFLADPSLKEKSVGLILGFDYDSGFFGATTFDLWA